MRGDQACALQYATRDYLRGPRRFSGMRETEQRRDRRVREPAATGLGRHQDDVSRANMTVLRNRREQEIIEGLEFFVE